MKKDGVPVRAPSPWREWNVSAMYIRRRRQWGGTEVSGGVVDFCEGERFATFDAGSAGSAMSVSAFVAGPSG